MTWLAVPSLNLLPENERAEAFRIREAIASCMCPWCGRRPFVVLARHTQAAHGVDRFELRDRAFLRSGDSVCDPDYSEMRREMVGEVAIPRGDNRSRRPSRVARVAGRENIKRATAAAASPAAWTAERRERIGAAQKKAWREPSEAMRRAAALRGAKRVKEHGINAYRRGCRCDECKACNREHYRRYFSKAGNPDGYARMIAKRRARRVAS